MRNMAGKNVVALSRFCSAIWMASYAQTFKTLVSFDGLNGVQLILGSFVQSARRSANEQRAVTVDSVMGQS